MISVLRQMRMPALAAWPATVPIHGAVGLTLVAVAWPVSWLRVTPFGEYAFFPLWLGYVLIVDALVLRWKGTSLLSRNATAFLGMFLASIPLWWIFEGINHFTQNWRYVGDEEYSLLRYVIVASLHFSIVIPAVFETAELAGSFSLIKRFRRGPVVPISRRILAGSMVLGVISLVALLIWPREAFAGTWLCLILLLDPINYMTGRPSIVGTLRRGDWGLVMALCTGALICGLFWEMWNFWAYPKWQYSISFVDFARVFEMPLLGYGGYLPFGLETYVVYHFLTGVVRKIPRIHLNVGGSISSQRLSDGSAEGRAPLPVLP
ncbi:MAG: hypothetical protein IIB30_04280 [Chloroflexi bacterium]|nr:hypothetical protein [Chloroflexota bacterium]